MFHLLQKISAPICILLFLSSCTRLVYSQEQLVNSLKTKHDVIVTFGLPTERKDDGEYYEWIYDFGNITVKSTFGSGNATIYGGGNSVYGNAYGSSVTQFNDYKRYVKITFDKNDNVIQVSSQGVDLSRRKPAPGRTVIGIVLLLAACIGLGVLLAAASD